MLTVKNTAIKTTIVHEDLQLFLRSNKAISASFTSSTFSVNSLTNLSANFFLHLQFAQSKYFPTSHNLSHSHSQLLGFQINLLPHITLSINSLH